MRRLNLVCNVHKSSLATHSGAHWFLWKNPLYVEETALLSLLLIYKGVKFAVMADMNYDGLIIFLLICLSAVSSIDSGLFFFFLVWSLRAVQWFWRIRVRFQTRTYCLEWQRWQGKPINFGVIYCSVVFFLLPRLALVAGGAVSVGESWVLSGLGVGGLEGFCFRYSAIARLTTTRVSWGTVKNSLSAQAPRCSISCWSR